MATGRFDEFPYLKSSFLSYLVLGSMDIIHHWHVGAVLKEDTAWHAVVTGLVLSPITVIMVWLYIRTRNKLFIRTFLVNAVLAVLVPGIYHGGWAHVVKILASLWSDGEATNIRLLFPPDNIHLWFYEITGVLEFVLGIVCACCLYKFLSRNSAQAS